MVTTRLLTIPVDKIGDRQIEVWREDDRLIVELTDALSVSAPGNRDSRILVPGSNPEGAVIGVREDGIEGAESEILAMTEEEWLTADLLALHRQAADLSRSVDETLAYVVEKCAAIDKA